MSKVILALLIFFMIIGFISLAIKFPRVAALLAVCYFIWVFAQWYLEE